jgi:hypothetical protein
MLPGLCFFMEFQLVGHAAVVVFLVWLAGLYGVSVFLALTWSLLYLGFVSIELLRHLLVAAYELPVMHGSKGADALCSIV